MTRTVQLHADDGGTGDMLPVVFLHSTAGNSTQWAARLDHLRPTRRAVALEWRGHSRSATPDEGNYAFPAMAADVGEAAAWLGIERFVLVGHSGGGLVTLQYTADHPERAAGLLLADPAGNVGRVPAERMVPFLSGLASDACADTIEGYWDFLLIGSQEALRGHVMADLRCLLRNLSLEILVFGTGQHPFYCPWQTLVTIGTLCLRATGRSS
jgi:pimeloyl-ACP methyl ester carboxylesterase